MDLHYIYISSDDEEKQKIPKLKLYRVPDTNIYVKEKSHRCKELRVKIHDYFKQQQQQQQQHQQQQHVYEIKLNSLQCRIVLNDWVIQQQQQQQQDMSFSSEGAGEDEIQQPQQHQQQQNDDYDIIDMDISEEENEADEDPFLSSILNYFLEWEFATTITRYEF